MGFKKQYTMETESGCNLTCEVCDGILVLLRAEDGEEEVFIHLTPHEVPSLVGMLNKTTKEI